MSDPGLLHSEIELQAAELALGLLDPADRASALRRQIADPGFAALVSHWRACGDGWLETITPDAVDPVLWERISSGMTAQSATASVGAAAISTLNAPARSDAARSLSRWKVATFAACAALVFLSVKDVQRARSNDGPTATLAPRELAATNVAQIAGKAGKPLISAVYSPEAGTLTLRVAQFDSTQRVPELWVIPAGGKPHSLGLVAGGSRVSVTLSNDLRRYLVDGSTIALTLEPPTGAPHQSPTGAILGTGTLATI